MSKYERKPPVENMPDAPGSRFVNLTNLRVVRAEQARLYRMLFSKKARLSSGDWERARRILIDVRDSLMAEAGKALPANTVVHNNTLVVSGGLQRTDELLDRFTRAGTTQRHERLVQERPVLPAEIHLGAGGHGAPVAVPADQGSGDES